jgi:hypothetical protein
MRTNPDAKRPADFTQATKSLGEGERRNQVLGGLLGRSWHTLMVKPEKGSTGSPSRGKLPRPKWICRSGSANGRDQPTLVW